MPNGATGFGSSVLEPSPEEKEKPMKTRRNKTNDNLCPEYDLDQLLKGGMRGKYAKRYKAGTNLVLLDPDVRRAFPSERAVNKALRLVIELQKAGSYRQP
jgi:hypothetical protein